MTIDLPDWIDRRTWEDYVEMRNTIRKPLTAGAIRRQLAKLTRMYREGHDIEAVLDQSIRNCWQDTYPLKGDGAETPIQRMLRRMEREERAKNADIP